MKTNRLLKIAIILSFLLLVINEIGVEMYKAAIEGWNNVYEHIEKPNRTIPVLIDGKDFIKETNSTHKIDSLKVLKDIKIEANLTTNSHEVPPYLEVLNLMLSIIFLYLTIGVLKRIYKVITAISNNQMFKQQVVNDIKRVGYYFLIGFIVAAIFDKVYIEQTVIMAGPKLHLIRTVDWPFGLLVSGFMMLLIAQAFEQGKKIQQEQELTI